MIARLVAVLALSLAPLPKPIFLKIDTLLRECAFAGEVEVVAVRAPAAGLVGSVTVRVTKDPGLVLRGIERLGQEVELQLSPWGPQLCAGYLAALPAGERTLWFIVNGKQQVVACGPRAPGERLGWRLRGHCDYNAVLFGVADRTLAAEFGLPRDEDEFTATARGMARVLGDERQGLAVLAMQQQLPLQRRLDAAGLRAQLRALDSDDAATAAAATASLARDGAPWIGELLAARDGARGTLRTRLDAVLAQLSSAQQAAQWLRAARQCGAASELALALAALTTPPPLAPPVAAEGAAAMPSPVLPPRFDAAFAAAMRGHALALAGRLPRPLTAAAIDDAALFAAVRQFAIVPEPLDAK